MEADAAVATRVEPEATAGGHAMDVRDLRFSYGRHPALNGATFSVPAGATYALLGPNGAGKTTLLHVLMGLRRAKGGSATVLGRDSRRLTAVDRQDITYVAEGQQLPGWMRLKELEDWLAPLYPRWDAVLAKDLRERFSLEPDRKIGTFSRGEQMKAAMLCAMAPRPKLIVMDEPFTGMDPLVKDEIVRGMLSTPPEEGRTVLISSHDIVELEMLADWIGFIDRGVVKVSEPAEQLRKRYRRVEVIIDESFELPAQRPADWHGLERAGRRVTFLTSGEQDAREDRLRAVFPGASRIEVDSASLREVFLVLAKHQVAGGRT